MSTSRQIKEEQRVSAQQKGLVGELQALVKDIERCEKTVQGLKTELQGVNERHANRTTTQDDIAYLEDLLACARKKLVWEKQIASLQKRTPELMQRVEVLVNHPNSNPDEETRNGLMGSLTEVQASMRRLNEIKI
jgi:predicted  nucleic acid-binding Zn-ribbon protein